MIFNSIEFLIFFPIVTLLYFALPFKWRWGFLLVASYYFYMSWNPAYISLIIISTLTTYFCARGMSPKGVGGAVPGAPGAQSKKLWLWLCLIVNLGILLAFKYLGFFTATAQSTLEILRLPAVLPTFKLLLPVGISFYTFQTIGYVIDVYKGKKEPERHLGYYALFVSFFPQLVAGPIERSASLLPQFKIKHKFDYDRIASGLRLAAWGMFKKIVISDRAAIIVDAIYNNPTEYGGASLAIATVLFAFQIFCDFSGYTDIAIGTARILGFNLTQNFNRPYSARSIADFWRRWHISLTSWFKDYIYIPLGGNRVSLAKWLFNIMLVFLISGLWHGAAWTFIIWGALHGAWQILEKTISNGRLAISNFGAFRKRNVLNKKSKKEDLQRKSSIIANSSLLIANFTSWAITFTFVTLAWIFFRADSFDNAIYILTQIFTTWNFEWLDIFADGKLVILVALIAVMELAQFWQARLKRQNRPFRTLPATTRWACYSLLLTLIFLFAEYGSQEFIYFQF
ncbi:MAG: MBOAT family protein [Oscillospiraceae bacterium]|nr:MBOAT family protein [Oscillospiraceae bacterium]